MYKGQEERGFDYSIQVLNDIAEEGNKDKLVKAFKDTMFFFTRLKRESLKTKTNEKMIMNLFTDIFGVLQKEIKDEEFEADFLKAIDITINEALIPVAGINKLLLSQFGKIESERLKDRIFDIMIVAKESMSEIGGIIDWLKKKDPFLMKLPSFCLYSVKYGLAFDRPAEYLQPMIELLRTRKLLTGCLYRDDLICYLRWFDEILKKLEVLKLGFVSLTDENIILLDKYQTEFGIDMNKKKKSEILRVLYNLTSRDASQATVDTVFKFILDHSKDFELQ